MITRRPNNEPERQARVAMWRRGCASHQWGRLVARSLVWFAHGRRSGPRRRIVGRYTTFKQAFQECSPDAYNASPRLTGVKGQ